MPPAPEVPHGLCQVGLAEVVGQADAQHPGGPQGDVAVPGKIGVELHRIEHRRQQAFHPAEGCIVTEHGIHRKGGPVGDDQLFKVAPQHQKQAVPDAGGVKGAGLFQLRQQLAAPGRWGPTGYGQKS